MAFSVLTLQAQDVHSFYLSAGGDFAMLLDNQKFTVPKIGGGGNMGFGYELQHGNFLFEVGVEGSFSRMRSKVNDFKRDYDAVDTEGDKFTWHHSFYNRLDEADLLNVNVPVMFGARFEQVYFLVGPKFSICAWGRSRERSLVDATATYEGLIGEFKDMANHSLYKGRELSDPFKDYKTGIDLRVAGEVGIPLNYYISTEPGQDKLTKAGIEMRLGVFVEAGVLNLRGNNVDGNLVDYKNVSTAPGVDFTETYVFRASETKDAYVTDLLAGLRFTVLFRLPKKKICVLCGDYYDYY